MDGGAREMDGWESWDLIDPRRRVTDETHREAELCSSYEQPGLYALVVGWLKETKTERNAENQKPSSSLSFPPFIFSFCNPVLPFRLQRSIMPFLLDGVK